MFCSLEDIKKELERSEDEKRNLLKAWQAVTYPTKKDGSPFAALPRNIDGAKIEQFLDYGENKLSVFTHSEKSGYISDDIYIYRSGNYLTEAQKAKPENICRVSYYSVYIYDLDDIKEAVTERIADLQKELQAIDYQKKHAEKAFLQFQKDYFAALERLERNTKRKENAGLYYLIKKAVQKDY